MNASTGYARQVDMANAENPVFEYPTWPGTKRVRVPMAREGVHTCVHRTWLAPIDHPQRVTRIIDEGRSPGASGSPADRAAVTILTAAIGVSHWFVRGQAVDAQEVSPEVSEQHMRQILAPGAESSEASHAS